MAGRAESRAGGRRHRRRDTVTREMAEQTADRRRATAERNVVAILDGTERLLSRGAPLTIAAVAGESGLSRVTVYAHFAGLPELVEAVVERAVAGSAAAVAAAEPERGPALDALDRLVAAGWSQLDRHHAVAAAAAEHLSAEALRRSHEQLTGTVAALLERGRDEGVVRDDLPPAWLVSALLALMHAAGDDVRAGRMEAATAPAVLQASLRSLVARG